MHTTGGLAIVINSVGNVESGISYISDLSESEDNLLEDSGFYEKQVAGVAAYVYAEFENIDMSFEIVSAVDSFAGLDEGVNKPQAWNIEMGYFDESSIEYALRFEKSNELEDEPRSQAGIGATWHASKYVSLTVEYLQGRYKPGFVEDDQEQILKYQKQLAAQAIISF